MTPLLVILAQAGIQPLLSPAGLNLSWTPACAGVTWE